MGQKAWCNNHQMAYDVADGCSYCVPPESKTEAQIDENTEAFDKYILDMYNGFMAAAKKAAIYDRTQFAALGINKKKRLTASEVAMAVGRADGARQLLGDKKLEKKCRDELNEFFKEHSFYWR